MEVVDRYNQTSNKKSNPGFSNKNSLYNDLKFFIPGNPSLPYLLEIDCQVLLAMPIKI